MMNKKREKSAYFFLTMILITMISFSGCRQRKGLLLLGIGDDQQIVKRYITHNETNELGNVLDEVSEETISLLNETKSQNDWELSQVRMGLALTATAGIVVVDISVEPSVELFFFRK